MRPEKEPMIERLSIDARVERVFPIRHVLIYDWEYGKANSWEEVKKLIGKYYYRVEADENTIVFTAPVKPTVIAVLKREGNKGELILINMDKYYTMSKLEVMGKKYLEMNTGLKLKKKERLASGR